VSSHSELSQIENALVGAAARLARGKPRRCRRIAIAGGLWLALVISSVALAGVSGEGPLAAQLHRDTVRPDVAFSLRPPTPGARRLQIAVRTSESVRLRLLVTEVGHRTPLLRRSVSFTPRDPRARSLPLAGVVGKGLLIISGIARDRAGNATQLPQCVIDPASGHGACTAP
jgi:hypothetical protein